MHVTTSRTTDFVIATSRTKKKIQAGDRLFPHKKNIISIKPNEGACNVNSMLLQLSKILTTEVKIVSETNPF